MTTDVNHSTFNSHLLCHFRFAYGPTMEWGFLFSIMQNPHIAELVDEVYIELHFHFPSLYWMHYHSNWEALDALRYLRAKGVIVHSWP